MSEFIQWLPLLFVIGVALAAVVRFCIIEAKNMRLEEVASDQPRTEAGADQKPIVDVLVWHNAHVMARRDYFIAMNARLAGRYIRQTASLVEEALDAFQEIERVNESLAQLHRVVCLSPMQKFWRIVRATRGGLVIKDPKLGDELPAWWQRTHKGLRYDLPGYHIFSRAPIEHKNLRLKRCFGAMLRDIDAVKNGAKHFHDGRLLFIADRIWLNMKALERAILRVQGIQRLVAPESQDALARWSDDSHHGQGIALRIVNDALVYSDSHNLCEIKIPAALKTQLQIPTMPRPFIRVAWHSRAAIYNQPVPFHSVRWLSYWDE